MARSVVGSRLDGLDQPAPCEEDGGHERGREEPVLDDAGRGLEKGGECPRVVKHACVVGDDATIRAPRHGAARDRPETLECGLEAKGQELERDRRVECRHGLGRVDDHDETVGRDSDELLPCVGGTTALYEPAVRPHLVGSIDRHVEVVQRRERLQAKSKRPGSGLGSGRTRHATKRQLPSGERREEECHGRSGAESHRHAVLDQRGRGFSRRLLFLRYVHAHRLPAPRRCRTV